MNIKSVLIAGASGGLGSAIAVNLAARGATLTLVSRNEARLHALDVAGHRVALDLRDPDSGRAVIDAAIEHAGRFDVVVKCLEEEVSS